MIDPDLFTHSNHPAFPYQAMLADPVRMTRYRAAIQAVVRPGDTVADLGTGTGVLAMMAAQCGASCVYAVEQRPRSLWMAEKLIRANGLEGRVRLIEGDAREVDLGTPIDVILNELIGDFGTDERIAECVDAFARRHLVPGGTILPRQIRTWLVPVEYGPEFRGVWREHFHGLDLSAGNAFPCRPEAVMQSLREAPEELGPRVTIEDIDFCTDITPRPSERSFEMEIAREGQLQGFLGAFEATLVDGISLASHPSYPGGHWKSWHWPVSPALRVAAGQRVQARLSMPSGGVALAWQLEWSVV